MTRPWYQAHREKELAKFAAWYQAHREEHKAKARARYQVRRRDILAQKRAYRRTAAGMLTSLRHHAKERGR